MYKLNLGCSERKIHGFINIDSREEVNPDVVGDVTDLDSIDIKNSSVDLIYASHIYKTKKGWGVATSCTRHGGCLRLLFKY